MVDNFDVQSVNYFDMDGNISRALIYIPTGVGYDRNMPTKQVRLRTNDQGEWYEPRLVMSVNPVDDPAKITKSAAVIEVREPEKVLGALLDVISQSAFNDGIGPMIGSERELFEADLDENEVLVRELYKKIKEQM